MVKIKIDSAARPDTLMLSNNYEGPLFFPLQKIDLKMVLMCFQKFYFFNEICYMVIGDDSPREYLKVFIPTMVSQNL